MRKLLLHNWGLKLASLILAVLLWFVVKQIDDPQDSKYFRDIEVTLVNTELLDDAQKMYQVLDNTDRIRVTVWAPSSVISQIDKGDIVAEADVKKLTDINTIPIDVNVNNAGIINWQSSLDAVRLSIEDKDSKYVQIKYTMEGEAAEGYIIGGVTMAQTMIEISGPESAVNNVSEARVHINIANSISDSFSAQMDIGLYDKEGKRVDAHASRIQQQQESVLVSVEVLATKNVPLEVGYVGSPADGYLTTGEMESSLSSVTIAGKPATLANVTRISIPEDRIDIAEAVENVVTVVNLKDYLPDNTRLADSEFDGNVTVTVYVEPEVERRLEIPAGNLSFINLPEGWVAELDAGQETYGLRVSGLQAQLDLLNPEAIMGTLDMARWMASQNITALKPGVYNNVPVRFTLEGGIDILSQVTARVTIREYMEEE